MPDLTAAHIESMSKCELDPFESLSGFFVRDLQRVRELVEVLNTQPQVKMLAWQHSGISTEMAVILSGLQHVTDLYLDYNGITNALVERLPEIAFPSLKFLSLETNWGLDGTIAGLIDRIPTLERLNVYGGNARVTLAIQQDIDRRLAERKSLSAASVAAAEAKSVSTPSPDKPRSPSDAAAASGGREVGASPHSLSNGHGGGGGPATDLFRPPSTGSRKPASADDTRGYAAEGGAAPAAHA